MSAPNLQLTVEPFESGNVVYAPMASPAVNEPELGRIMLQLSISNLEAQTVQLENLSVTPTGPGSYVSKTLPLKWFWTTNGVEQSAVITLAPQQAKLWWFQHPSDNVLFNDSPQPTQVELGVTAAGFSDRATFVFPLAPHIAPVPAEAYLFPGVSTDLDTDEYWETNGASHGLGAEGSQAFAYDLGVWTADGDVSPWLRPQTTGTKNSDFRIWKKPIHAMADGTVSQALFDVPTNPKPLTGPDWDAQFAAQKAATWGKYLTDHGYDYDLDEPHAGAGNHLYVQHGDEIVLYAHMQPNSIPQALRIPGASVQAGALLGLAGNSGNSSAPHLHVHAIKGTEAEVGPLRPLVFAPFTVLETDLLSASPQPWVGVAIGRSLPALDALIWPAFSPNNHRPRGGDVAIDPLALVLRDDIYAMLTLPDPPPLERLLREVERELANTRPAVRRRLAHRLDDAGEFLARVEQAAKSGVT